MTAILPSTIPIDGRPSGEAYVQFSDVSETWRALQAKNGARMDRRYIELFPASKQEMTFAAQGGDPRGEPIDRFQLTSLQVHLHLAYRRLAIKGSAGLA